MKLKGDHISLVWLKLLPPELNIYWNHISPRMWDIVIYNSMRVWYYLSIVQGDY